MKPRSKKPWRFSHFQRRVLKAVIHLIATGYLVALFYLGVNDQLGPDPVDALLNETGIWAIHLLFVTLLLSPLAKRLPSPEPIKFRRMLGIYVFVYAITHFFTYAFFELQLDWHLLTSELVKRPYIVVGMVALILLMALTVTSLSVLRRKMGKQWQRLHYSIYAILPLALLHFSWSQKTFWQAPIFYWLIGLIIMRGRITRTAAKTVKRLKAYQ